MKPTSSKDVNKLIRQFKKQGWEFQRRSKHGCLISPFGEKVFISTTPSDHRALKNIRSMLAGCP